MLPLPPPVPGSTLYLAPEVTPLRASLAGYGLEADVWSAGVCAFVLLCGEHPFTADSEAELLHRLAAGPTLSLDARAWASVSPAGRDFVARLLRAAPGERPSAAAALRHAWFAPQPPPSPPRRATGEDEREEVDMIAGGARDNDAGADAGGDGLRRGGWRGVVVRVVPLAARQPALPPSAPPPAEDYSAAPAAPAAEPSLRFARISHSGSDAARALIRAVRARFPRRDARRRDATVQPQPEQQQQPTVEAVVAAEAPAEDAPAADGAASTTLPGDRRWCFGCAAGCSCDAPAADAPEQEESG
jgi:hypothetical protein